MHWENQQLGVDFPITDIVRHKIVKTIGKYQRYGKVAERDDAQPPEKAEKLHRPAWRYFAQVLEPF